MKFINNYNDVVEELLLLSLDAEQCAKVASGLLREVHIKHNNADNEYDNYIRSYGRIFIGVKPGKGLVKAGNTLVLFAEERRATAKARAEGLVNGLVIIEASFDAEYEEPTNEYTIKLSDVKLLEEPMQVNQFYPVGSKNFFCGYVAFKKLPKSYRVCEWMIDNSFSKKKAQKLIDVLAKNGVK